MDIREQKLANVKKSIGVTAKVVDVFRILARVAAIVLAVCAAGCFIFHNKVDETVAKQLENKEGTLEFSNYEFGGLVNFDADIQKIADEGHYAYAFGASLVYAAVISIIFIVFLRIFLKIFSLLLESESPFSTAIMSRIKKSFIALVIVVAIFFDLGLAVLLALVLWSIYCILDYGCALQQQSDETL